MWDQAQACYLGEHLTFHATVDSLINVETIQHFNASSIRFALYNVPLK
jgi:hypothetical protein